MDIQRMQNGLRNRNTGYSYNLAGDASPSVVTGFAPISPYRGVTLY